MVGTGTSGIVPLIFRGCFLSNFIILILHIVFVSIALAHGLERKISSDINPGCEKAYCKEKNFTVVYLKAVGPNDTIHYLWDLSKKPSILLAVTSLNATLNIDWENFNLNRRNIVTFSPSPIYTFGIAVSKIWEYNDINDTGYLNLQNKTSGYLKELDTSNFLWKRVEYKNDSETTFLTVESHHYNDSSTVKNGTLKIQLSGFGFLDHSDDLPHLLHTANTTQVDIVIDGLATDPAFSSSRFAIEIVMVSKEHANTTIKIDPRKSLDDEHTPGVFTLIDVQTPSSISSSAGGYLQWRPVAYVSKYRDLSNSTDTNVYSVSNVKNTSVYLRDTLLQKYYDLTSPNLLVQSTAVSFGLKKDGFYKKTNYTSWTFTMGYGKPPDEDFSLLVILVISIGLGLPALLIIISGIVMAIRRVSRKKDDLCLSR